MADRTPTLGDLCSAIAEGHIATTIDGAMYQLNAFEVRRYLNRFRSLPTITTVLDQSSASHSDSDNWSAPQISVA
ncbi:MAG: hypothetical protein NVS4B7_08410 [Ktedonobacteraceae bacterium]